MISQVLSVSRDGNGKKCSSHESTSVSIGQNSSEEHCKKGDVQMTDDQAKNERL